MFIIYLTAWSLSCDALVSLYGAGSVVASACGILAPQPGIKPAFLVGKWTLQTTGPSGKSLVQFWLSEVMVRGYTLVFTEQHLFWYLTFNAKSLGGCCEIKDIFIPYFLIVYIKRNVCWQTYALYVSLKVSLRFSCYYLESSKERFLSEVLSFQKAAVYIGSRIGTYLQNEKLWVY